MTIACMVFKQTAYKLEKTEFSGYSGVQYAELLLLNVSWHRGLSDNTSVVLWFCSKATLTSLGHVIFGAEEAVKGSNKTKCYLFHYTYITIAYIILLIWAFSSSSDFLLWLARYPRYILIKVCNTLLCSHAVISRELIAEQMFWLYRHSPGHQ